MKLFKLSFLISALIATAACDLVVRTKFGLIRGKWQKTTKNISVASFLGLPYAEPPTGNLRFENPRPWNNKWSNIRDARSDAAMCPQSDFSEANNILGEEDCLYLNVFTPVNTESQEAVSKRNLPVLVYIHGGAYTVGSSNSSLLAPTYLLNHDIVLVTVNYRLNVLGFFSTGNDVTPGNNGLKDIVVALRWIQENIRSFGGNPNSVTLSGQSSGSISTHLLSYIPKTEGLFHKIITMSGMAASPVSTQTRRTARYMSLKVAEAVGCAPPNASEGTQNFSQGNGHRDCRVADRNIVRCMKSADYKLIVGRGWLGDELNFRPTLEPESEEAVVTTHPAVVARECLFRDIPWLAGVTRDEGLYITLGLMKNQTAQQELISIFENFLFSIVNRGDGVYNITEIAKKTIDFYFRGDINRNLLPNLTQLSSDALFHWPTLESLMIQTPEMKSRAFLYEFSYEGTFSSLLEENMPQRYGVAHTDELNYLFPYYSTQYANLGLSNNENDLKMIDITTEMWANFVRNGVPSAKMTPKWEAFQTHHRYMKLGDGNRPTVSMNSNFLGGKIKFWEDVTYNLLKPIKEVRVASRGFHGHYNYCPTRN